MFVTVFSLTSDISLSDVTNKNYLPDCISIEERYSKIEKADFILTEEEPLFDAAEILRFCKDMEIPNRLRLRIELF